MKSLADSVIVPTIASMVMIGSLALFFVLPVRPLHELPEAENGARYCFRDHSKLVHVSVFRDGAMAMGGQTVSLADLRERLTNIRSSQEKEWWGIRLSVQPDAPMKAVLKIYDASHEASFDAMYFAVVPKVHSY